MSLSACARRSVSAVSVCLCVCQVLEERLDRKREAVLEKELVLEEVTALSEKLRSQAVAKRDAAKALADELNDLQVHDYPALPYSTLPYPSVYPAMPLP